VRWPALAILLLIPPMWMGEFGTLVLATGAITIMAALGLHVLTHWAGQASLGHVAFQALGAFVTANLALRTHAPFWVAIPAAALGGVVASVVISLPALRIRGPYLAITTLAFGIAADRWLFRQVWLTGGSSGVLVPAAKLSGISLASSRSLYYVIVPSMVVMIALARAIGTSKAGRAFRAIRADEEVATTWSINVTAYKLLAFAVAGAFAGFAGGLQAYSLGIVGSLTFPVSLSIRYLAIVVIGGAGGIWGTVVAAAVFGMLPSLQANLGRYATLAGALGILLVVRFPGGLNGVGHRIRRQIRSGG
jgi:branched-chain amino acid transport system permease protein